MIPAYNKKRCAAFPFETGIHFRRKTDFFPEEDTTKSYSGFEPTRLQAEGHSHHTGWATFEWAGPITDSSQYYIRNILFNCRTSGRKPGHSLINFQSPTIDHQRVLKCQRLHRSTHLTKSRLLHRGKFSTEFTVKENNFTHED
ncbi:hypothetical protein TNCV_806191 [Trichonephila clavipes]|nr:hypothetical protein TNCV_806191 [Trichonephila clavipes]